MEGEDLELKRLLASSCRQKLLVELARARELNVTRLVTRVNSTYNDVQRNLKILEAEGIVAEKRVGRQRLISLDRENPGAKALLGVLRALENEERKQPLRTFSTSADGRCQNPALQ
ncbi:TPA: winged helix-turn-helix transcriptional regulator [Candidatus Bathyarchaeota archaeon]|nr:winged helix-turn-helix transcriptional regulator [Candidatus Bathyarchaeota archaeon]